MTIHLMKGKRGKTYCGDWASGDMQGSLRSVDCLCCLRAKVSKLEKKLVKLRKMWEEIISDLRSALRF